MADLNALVAKWRESADKLDKGFGPGDMLVACGKRTCADELEAALSAHGQPVVDTNAVAWCLVDTAGYHVFTSDQTQAAQWSGPGDTVTPLYTKPAGVTEAMKERALLAFTDKYHYHGAKIAEALDAALIAALEVDR